MSINARCGMTVFLLAIVVMSSQAIASQGTGGSSSISVHEAANLMQLPLSCAETEYPNKLSQTLRFKYCRYLLGPRVCCRGIFHSLRLRRRRRTSVVSSMANNDMGNPVSSLYRLAELGWRRPSLCPLSAAH